MQAKIDAFFKPSIVRNPISSFPRGAAPPQSVPPATGFPDLDVVITYKRRRDPNLREISCSEEAKEIDDQTSEVVTDISVSTAKVSNIGNILNKKRTYGQYFLELGQSDFLLHTCSICGMKYARGNEDDEKVHKTFHNNYYQGIIFKVLQVANLLEAELGFSDGWLLHKLCKVYLFISNNRIVGCVIAEPIKRAYRVISNSTFSSDGNSRKTTKSTLQTSSSANVKLRGSEQTVLQFGNISFRREVMKRIPPIGGPKMNVCYGGAIFCEEVPVPALCGIRAVWVVPSKRRRHVATQILDSVRKTFEPNYLIEASKCAFSQPTSAGKALASSYCGTQSFLVYTAEDN